MYKVMVNNIRKAISTFGLPLLQIIGIKLPVNVQNEHKQKRNFFFFCELKAMHGVLHLAALDQLVNEAVPSHE